MGAVSIKGSKEGLTAYISSSDYEEIKSELYDKLNEGREFFAGCNLKLTGDNKLSDCEYEKLSKYLKEQFSINAIHNVQDKSNDNINSVQYFTDIYEGKTKFIERTVRSGERILYNGNIIVIGDVNSGAEVIAFGNIVVLGVLRGIAHAGFNGNKKAIVAAYMLEPAQLRIADLIARAPDEKVEKPQMPEVASIHENNIIVEPYLPEKYY